VEAGTPAGGERDSSFSLRGRAHFRYAAGVPLLRLTFGCSPLAGVPLCSRSLWRSRSRMRVFF